MQQKINNNIQATLEHISVDKLIEKELQRLYRQAIDRLTPRQQQKLQDQYFMSK